MISCKNCNRRIYFWNGWNGYCKKYPAVQAIDGKTENIYFCCGKCAWQYIAKFKLEKIK